MFHVCYKLAEESPFLRRTSLAGCGRPERGDGDRKQRLVSRPARRMSRVEAVLFIDVYFSLAGAAKAGTRSFRVSVAILRREHGGGTNARSFTFVC